MISIAEIERNLEQLPLLPDVVVRLLQLKPDDEFFFDKVLELSQEDPTFALQVIQLANSASSSPISQIKSLEEAVARVGAAAITGLITSMAVLRVFVPINKGEKELWIHSIQVAVIAKKIAATLSKFKIDPNQAYLCGLLHDIGRFVMFDKDSSRLDEVNNTNWNSPEELIQAELKLCGYDHSKLGGKVCVKWGLPGIVRQVVSYHHMYSRQQQLAIKSNSNYLYVMLNVVQIADRLSVVLLNNDEMQEWSDDDLKKAYKECTLSSKSAVELDYETVKKIVSLAIKESKEVSLGLGLG